MTSKTISQFSSKPIGQTANQNMYQEYIRALTSQNEQYRTELQIMQKEIQRLSKQLHLQIQQKQGIMNQFQRFRQSSQQKDLRIYALQKMQTETSKLLKSKTQQISSINKYWRLEQSRLSAELLKYKKYQSFCKIENKILDYRVQKQQVNRKQNKMQRVYSFKIYEEGEAIKNALMQRQIQEIKRQNTYYKTNTQSILSTLNMQQTVVNQYTAKIDALGLLVKQKEKQIEALESSNQYLRNLNQSLILGNTQSFKSIRCIKSSKSKLKSKLSKELNSTTQQENNFQVNPLESNIKIMSQRIIKTCNSEALLSPYPFS